MDFEQVHYCQVGRKGKVLSANLLGDGGVKVRMADRDCCLQGHLGRKAVYFPLPYAPQAPPSV